MRELSEELTKLAKRLKVEFEPKFGNSDKVSRVRFKFPRATWAELADRQGDLLAACCANISAIREVFLDGMQDSGWIDVASIRKLVINMSGHDFDADHPATLVKKAYDAIEPHVDFSGTMTGHVDLSDPQDVCQAIYFSQLFSHLHHFCAKYGSDCVFSNWGQSPHDRAQHNKLLFSIIPIVKSLGEIIHKSGFQPVEGYAIVRKANNEIYEMYHGLAIFSTDKEAAEVMDRFVKSEQLQSGDAEIRMVRVSWEKGVEVLEAITSPWVVKKDQMTRDKDVERALDAVVSLREKTKDDRVEAIMAETFKKLRNLERE